MLFKDLLRLRRHPSGLVPMEVLEALELPMPQEVLEDFVQKTGTHESFQQLFGELDLHTLRWERRSLPASELLACSFDAQFAQFVTERANQARRVITEGWGKVTLTDDSIRSWKEHRTWRRAPTSLRGDVVGSPASICLIEGYIRLGMLRGLVESGWLSRESHHEIWVGEGGSPPQPDGPWHEVLRKERMSFLDWVMGHVGDETELGQAASMLIQIQHNIMEPTKVEGPDLQAVLAFAETVPALSILQDAITKAHTEWETYTTQ